VLSQDVAPFPTFSVIKLSLALCFFSGNCPRFKDGDVLSGNNSSFDSDVWACCPDILSMAS